MVSKFASGGTPQRLLLHPTIGECVLVRVEGVQWVVRPVGDTRLYRVPPGRRGEFIELDGDPPDRDPSSPASKTAEELNGDGVRRLLWAIRHPEEYHAETNAEVTEPKPVGGSVKARTAAPAARPDASNGGLPSPRPTSCPASETAPKAPEAGVKPRRPDEGVRLRRLFESLRNGLNPPSTELQRLAVGIEVVQKHTQNLLDDVAVEGGRAAIIRGAYGHGKTFCLELLKETALRTGYLVASTEVNAFENKLDRPDHVYRDLMRNLRIPDGGLQGVHGLAERAWRAIWADRRSAPDVVRRWLRSELQCEPLAWLLSDARVHRNPLLLGLLASEPGHPMPEARRAHVLAGAPRDWPAFTAGTQGDFASYVLCGIGRLAKMLGYKGFVIIMDEMEKWQDLNWRAQTRAGNLLGGLIWGATAEHGHRRCKGTHRTGGAKRSAKCDHSDILSHSLRCGGYPFTTRDRCFVGLAIAMTPRGDDGPEKQWSEYGLLEVVDLPAFTDQKLRKYCQNVFPHYCLAYGLSGEMPQDLPARAVAAWRRRGDGSTRTAVQSVCEVLDSWREGSST